ncbi:MAG: threonine synthase, partial [Anaerolineae bacterium]|nr:threonine synthase [Anaerolineae bacterium]
MASILQCMDCGRQYPINSVMYVCEACGGLLDVEHELDLLRTTHPRETFDRRLGSLDHPHKSGVWRFKELVNPDAPDDLIVSYPEGNTNLYNVP